MLCRVVLPALFQALLIGAARGQSDYDAHSTDSLADFARCGGKGYDGSAICTHEGSVCTKQSDAWSMCFPRGGASTHGAYDLQLYGWKIESKFFTDNMWGNHWLGFYNACYQQGNFPGGIGFCGSWGATLERMIECGTGNQSAGVEQRVVRDFCSAMHCAFVPAVVGQDHPYLYRSVQCDLEVPTFEESVLNLTSLMCGSFDCPVVVSGIGGMFATSRLLLAMVMVMAMSVGS